MKISLEFMRNICIIRSLCNKMVTCILLSWKKNSFGFFCKLVWKTQMNILANTMFPRIDMFYTNVFQAYICLLQNMSI